MVHKLFSGIVIILFKIRRFQEAYDTEGVSVGEAAHQLQSKFGPGLGGGVTGVCLQQKLQNPEISGPPNFHARGLPLVCFKW